MSILPTPHTDKTTGVQDLAPAPAPTSTGPLTVKSVEANIGPQVKIDVVDDKVYVTHEGTGWNGGFSLVTNRSDTWKIFGDLFKDPRVGWGQVDIYASGTDKYGQPGSMLATRYVMTRETAQKLGDNLNNQVRYWMLDDVADSIYVAPGVD